MSEAEEGHQVSQASIEHDGPPSQRQYWRDSATGIVREIWRPGDGDGQFKDDYFGKIGQPAPMETRWRLYLSTLEAIEPGKLEPPKYVILDDKAAYQIATSKISKAKITRYWDHDFGGKAVLRHHRTHRGNPAIINDTADGIDRYGWIHVGKLKRKHYFTGEKDFTPLSSSNQDRSNRQNSERMGLIRGGVLTTSKKRKDLST